mgnify:CR=1 FL=1
MYEKDNSTWAEILVILWNNANRNVYNAMHELVSTINEEVEEIEAIDDENANKFIDSLLENYVLEDVLLVTHLNDVVVAQPVFVKGELLAWTASIAHWNDVGGMTPGSMPADAVEIFQEGLRLPGVRVVEEGRLSETIVDIIEANIRLPPRRARGAAGRDRRPPQSCRLQRHRHLVHLHHGPGPCHPLQGPENRDSPHRSESG